MLDLLKDWPLMRKYGRAGRERVQTVFAERFVIDATLDVYERMLGDDRQAIAA